MKADILTAVINIVESRSYNLKDVYIRTNRANSMGDALEKYVVDSFANTFFEKDEEVRLRQIGEIFSYIGNDSNPPDGMLRNGPAIEIKKIGSRNAKLQLNSSSPKTKLYSDDPRLTKGAINAEKWTVKDIIYVIGFVDKNNTLKELALIDSSLYCAENNLYEDVFNKIKDGVATIENIDFSPTRELGRVNKIDPLEFTSLRIRGMWLVDNPFDTFSYVYEPEKEAVFNLVVLVPSDKFKSSPNYKRLLELEKITEELKIVDIVVKSPDNPAKLINSKMIVFYVSKITA